MTQTEMRSAGMTVAEVMALPVSFDIVTAGKAHGLGRTKSHALARSGQFPCPVRRVGYTYRVTRADLLESLGIDPALTIGDAASREPTPAA
jgi:hypothetical protein